MSPSPNPSPASAHLRAHQRQLDVDGVEVAVSRQALEEVLVHLDRLAEANGILEDALQEVGDDYPGSSCQEWCRNQVKAARAVMEADHV